MHRISHNFRLQAKVHYSCTSSKNYCNCTSSCSKKSAVPQQKVFASTLEVRKKTIFLKEKVQMVHSFSKLPLSNYSSSFSKKYIALAKNILCNTIKVCVSILEIRSINFAQKIQKLPSFLGIILVKFWYFKNSVNVLVLVTSKNVYLY